jgi:ribosomal protein L19E
MTALADRRRPAGSGRAAMTARSPRSGRWSSAIRLTRS